MLNSNNVISERIESLQSMKETLIAEYGIYGGGPMITKLHNKINLEIKLLKESALELNEFICSTSV